MATDFNLVVIHLRRARKRKERMKTAMGLEPRTVRCQLHAVETTLQADWYTFKQNNQHTMIEWQRSKPQEAKILHLPIRTLGRNAMGHPSEANLSKTWPNWGELGKGNRTGIKSGRKTRAETDRAMHDTCLTIQQYSTIGIRTRTNSPKVESVKGSIYCRTRTHPYKV